MAQRETTYSVELSREEDGRWIGAVPELPGVLAYGATEDEAASAVLELAFQVFAEKIAHGELAVPGGSRRMKLPLVAR